MALLLTKTVVIQTNYNKNYSSAFYGSLEYFAASANKQTDATKFITFMPCAFGNFLMNLSSTSSTCVLSKPQLHMIPTVYQNVKNTQANQKCSSRCIQDGEKKKPTIWQMGLQWHNSMLGKSLGLSWNRGEKEV